MNRRHLNVSSIFKPYIPALYYSLKEYSKEKLLSDVMAGLIVGIVALPLSIAFGIASGVSPEKGIITAIIGGAIVSFLGGCRVQIGGPTGAFIIIVYGIIEQYGAVGLTIATVLAGILLVIMGLLRVGTVIKFIPYPIVVGFTAGIALVIFTTQMQDLFGLSIDKVPGDFISKWLIYGKSIATISIPSTLIGIGSIALIIFSSKRIKKIPGSLIAIIVFSFIAYCARSFFGIEGIETIGDRFTFKSSLPGAQSIPFTLDTIKVLFPVAFTIAMLAAIESLLSASVADGVIGDQHNSNTELIAQGAANIVVPFFGGIPVTGAIARTMTNINNGGKTPVAGIIHAIVLLLILLFLGPLTRHIPMACLAGILVIVAYNMSQWRTFKAIMEGEKSDIAVLLTTFLLTVLLDLTIAIEIGLLIAMLLFMRRMSEATKVSIVRDELDLSKESEVSHDLEPLSVPHDIEIYEIEGPFFFGIANKFDSCMRVLGDKPKVRILRMRKVPFIDSTGLHNLYMMAKSCEDNNIRLVLSGVNESVLTSLHLVKLDTTIGKEYICSNIHDALTCAKKCLETLD